MRGELRRMPFRIRSAAAYASALALALAAAAACLAACTKTPEQLSEDDPAAAAERGRKLVAVYGCATCHRISGVHGMPGTIGPPLIGWSGRRYIAGTLPNEPRKLALWLRNPQEVEPGTAMPDLGVSEEEAMDMASFLYSQ